MPYDFFAIGWWNYLYLLIAAKIIWYGVCAYTTHWDGEYQSTRSYVMATAFSALNIHFLAHAIILVASLALWLSGYPGWVFSILLMIISYILEAVVTANNGFDDFHDG